MIKNNVLTKILGFSLLLLSSNPVFALACKSGTNWSSASIAGTTSIPSEVLMPTANVPANTVIWRSSVESLQITCFDINHQGKAEDAYLYLDPDKTLASLPSYIDVGITINGVDYSSRSYTKVYMGQGITLPKNGANCRQIGLSSLLYSCATPNTTTLSFSVYVKTNSIAVKPGAITTSNVPLGLFQIDGTAGLNSISKDYNYFRYIGGLSNIKFVDCVPSVLVFGSSTFGTVDFGKVNVSPGNTNTIIKQVPFNIFVRMTLAGSTVANTECANKDLMINFVSSSVKNSNTILPDGRTDLGIQILPAGSTTPVTLNKIIPFGRTDAASQVITAYEAALIPLVDKPAAGAFSATTILEVTFK